MPIIYSTYQESYFEAYFDMAKTLFPDYAVNALLKDLKYAITSENHEAFFAVKGDSLLGFVNVSIRTDYVEGASSSPVGYLEALYVKPQIRNKGIARALCRKAENWAKSRGCTQMGSDTWVTNSNSRRFHLSIGFKEEDILVHFIKEIDPDKNGIV